MKQIAIFASGRGSNAEKIISYFKGHSKIGVGLIVSNRSDAGVLKIAAAENLPVLIIEKERFFRGDHYVGVLREFNIDIIVLAGFLWKIPDGLISAFERCIINIHPALLPKFGGKGMYGEAVHQAVVAAGEAQSGITIHYVDGHYDNGDIIFQAICAVDKNDTAASLAEKVHQLEHAHFPKVIEELLANSKC